MSNKNYTQTFSTDAAPAEVVNKISQVSAWWAKNFQGEATDVGDVFTVRFNNGDTYTIKIAKIIPNKQVAWEVLDSFQGWVKRPTEWVGTKIIWDIDKNGSGSEVRFTHQGLTSELECFDKCTAGWNYLMLESLSQLVNTGKGLPV